MICEVTAMTRSDGRTHVHSNIANCGKRDRQKVTIHRNNTDINLIIKLVHGICNMKLSNIFPIIPKRDLGCFALKNNYLCGITNIVSAVTRSRP